MRFSCQKQWHGPGPTEVAADGGVAPCALGSGPRWWEPSGADSTSHGHFVARCRGSWLLSEGMGRIQWGRVRIGVVVASRSSPEGWAGRGREECGVSGDGRLK